MRHLHPLTALLCGLAWAMLAAALEKAPLGRFSLEVHERTEVGRDFVRDWQAAHKKWGRDIPGKASSFALGETDGLVEIHPVGTDEIFIADIAFGNPPQVLKMAFDTGSADVWVQSSDTTYRTNQNGPWAPQYKPNASETSQIVESAVWEVQYVDGSVASGIVYTDTVQIGGFTIDNATVQSAQLVAPAFERETSLTGILGLAKSLSNNISPPTTRFLDLLRPQLENPVFTADLRRNATGRFDFGYVDTSLASDELTWLETIPESPHWDIELDLTTWKSENGTWWYNKFAATVDTGTTLLFLPNELASMYWADVPGVRSEQDLSNAFVFPCNLTNELPDLQFKLPGTEHIITIPGPYLSHSRLKADPEFCWGGMQSAVDLQSTILGGAMLKAVFVAFDLQTNRVGFANKHLVMDQ